MAFIPPDQRGSLPPHETLGSGLPFQKRVHIIPTWTDEAVDRLTMLNAAGHSSREIANKISAEFGMTFTRNAVIGKIHRLGIARERATARGDGPRVQMIIALNAEGVSRREIIQRVGCRFEMVTAVLGRLSPVNAASRRKSPIRPKAWTASPERAETGFTAESVKVGFFDLERHHCRWPVDDLYCGANKADGYSYCAAHCRAAYVPPKARVVKADLPVYRTDKVFGRFA